MNNIEKYLKLLGEDVRREYNTDINGNFRDCRSIAEDIVELLKTEGQNPFIMRIDDRKTSLRPRLFPDVKWGCHYVACTEEYAFDPLIGTPLHFKDYLSAVFEESSTMRIKQLE